MLQPARTPLQHQQPGLVPLRRRTLRNQLWRQLKIKIARSHRPSILGTGERFKEAVASQGGAFSESAGSR